MAAKDLPVWLACDTLMGSHFNKLAIVTNIIAVHVSKMVGMTPENPLKDFGAAIDILCYFGQKLFEALDHVKH